jgi:hypothetical protein
MEVDLMVASELWPIETEATFDTKIRSNIANGSSEVEGATHILATTLV